VPAPRWRPRLRRCYAFFVVALNRRRSDESRYTLCRHRSATHPPRRPRAINRRHLGKRIGAACGQHTRPGALAPSTTYSQPIAADRLFPPFASAAPATGSAVDPVHTHGLPTHSPKSANGVRAVAGGAVPVGACHMGGLDGMDASTTFLCVLHKAILITKFHLRSAELWPRNVL
jgi:hypothetical protein